MWDLNTVLQIWPNSFLKITNPDQGWTYTIIPQKLDPGQRIVDSPNKEKHTISHNLGTRARTHTHRYIYIVYFHDLISIQYPRVRLPHLRNHLPHCQATADDNVKDLTGLAAALKAAASEASASPEQSHALPPFVPLMQGVGEHTGS